MQKVIVKSKKNPDWQIEVYLNEDKEAKFTVWTKEDELRRVEFHFPKHTHYYEKVE